MTSAAILLFCVSGVLSGADSLPREPVSLAVRLHDLEWTNVSVDEAARLLHGFERIDLSLTADSQYRRSSCDGATYLQSKTPANETLEFTIAKKVGSDGCATALRAFSAQVELDSASAEASRLRLITQLHASGATAAGMNEYQWRSDDSRIRYTLTTEIRRKPGKGTAIFMFKLRHEQVSPDMVDGLPFRKGYFPPKCNRAD